MKDLRAPDGNLLIAGALLLAAGVAMGETFYIVVGLLAGVACLLLSNLLRRRGWSGVIQKKLFQDETGEVQVTCQHPPKVGRDDCEPITLTLCNQSRQTWPSPMIFFADLDHASANGDQGNTTPPRSTAVLPVLDPGHKTSTDIQFLGRGKQVQMRFWIVPKSCGSEQPAAQLEFDIEIDVQAIGNETVLMREQVSR
jgi:hypothetical protein